MPQCTNGLRKWSMCVCQLKKLHMYQRREAMAILCSSTPHKPVIKLCCMMPGMLLHRGRQHGGLCS